MDKERCDSQLDERLGEESPGAILVVQEDPDGPRTEEAWEEADRIV